MATIIDELRTFRYVYVKAHSARTARVPYPSLVDRPGYETPEFGVKRYKGTAQPLHKLRELKERWRRGKGGDDGGS